jgi:hypothetical protein
MEKLPELGKIHPDFFNKVIYPKKIESKVTL